MNKTLAAALISLMLPLAALAATGTPSVVGPPGTGSTATPQALIGRVIKAVLGVVGSIAFLMFVIGGIVWMTAGGNEKRVQQGRDTIVWATLGIVVIMAAYAIVSFLLSSFSG